MLREKKVTVLNVKFYLKLVNLCILLARSTATASIDRALCLLTSQLSCFNKMRSYRKQKENSSSSSTVVRRNQARYSCSSATQIKGMIYGDCRCVFSTHADQQSCVKAAWSSSPGGWELLLLRSLPTICSVLTQLYCKNVLYGSLLRNVKVHLGEWGLQHRRDLCWQDTCLSSACTSWRCNPAPNRMTATAAGAARCHFHHLPACFSSHISSFSLLLPAHLRQRGSICASQPISHSSGCTPRAQLSPFTEGTAPEAITAWGSIMVPSALPKCLGSPHRPLTMPSAPWRSQSPSPWGGRAHHKMAPSLEHHLAQKAACPCWPEEHSRLQKHT